jgi:hypothetical protein
MNEQTISAVMLATNPTRGLTDNTLEELFPLSLLTARIYEGVADDSVTVAASTRVPLWRRAPALVTASAAAVGLVVAGIISVTGPATNFVISGVALSPPVSALTPRPLYTPSPTKVEGGSLALTNAKPPRPTVPVCRFGQIRETLHLHTVNGVTTFGWRGSVTFENRGTACYLRRTWVGLTLVAGAAHRVLESSITPVVAWGGYVVLDHSKIARAPIAIYAGGPRSGNSCQPQVADGVVILSLYQHWPSEFFALPSRLRVCQSDPTVSIAGGLLVKEAS